MAHLAKIVPKLTHGTMLMCSVGNCSWVFSSKEKLLKHLRIHNSNKPFQCNFEDCNKQFKSKSNLKVHIQQVHEGAKNFKCNVEDCLESFHTDRNLTAHLQMKHNLPTKYLCEEPHCGYSFGSNAALQAHARIHKNPRPELKCHLCIKEFTMPCRLKAHIQEHERARAHACPHQGCGWTFATPSKLARHLATHNKVSRNVTIWCPSDGCNKFYSRRDHLQSHIKTHEHKFLCPFGSCTVALATQEEISQHFHSAHSPLSSQSEGNSASARTCVSYEEVQKRRRLGQGEAQAGPLTEENYHQNVPWSSERRASVPSSDVFFSPNSHISSHQGTPQRLISWSPERRDGSTADPPDLMLTPPCLGISLQEELMGQEFVLLDSANKLSDFEHSTINLRDLE